jgi:hypothetical protein
MLPNSQCIIILGMHRSGTSALSGVLNLLGIYPGSKLMPAVEEVNPKGFWEHTEIVSLHEKLLSTLNSSWDDELPLPKDWWKSEQTTPIRNSIIEILHRDFDNQSIWLLKDPRMCRLMPLWFGILQEIACQPLFIVTLRTPLEVAHSLRKRDNIEEATSNLIWLSYMLEAELQTRSHPRVFVKYSDLLSDWRLTITRIGEQLAISWPTAIENAASSIDDYLDSSLRHQCDKSNNPDHPTARLAQEVFLLLSSHSLDLRKLEACREQTSEAQGIFAPTSRELRIEKRRLQELQIELAYANTQNATLEAENIALCSEITRIKSSASWVITKPLRLLAFLIRNSKMPIGKLQTYFSLPPLIDNHCALVPFGYPPVEWQPPPSLAVACHMFYIDMVGEFALYLSNIPYPFDLFITTDTKEKCAKLEEFFYTWNKGKVEVRITQNRGRDIAPKLISCRDIYDKYEYILFIHTKRSPHRSYLNNWRPYLLDSLLGSPEVVKSIFEVFRSVPNIGLIAPQHFDALHNSIGWGKNFRIASEVALKMGSQLTQSTPLDFPSGSMFWSRSTVIKPLLDCNFTFNDFPEESGQLDETLGHAIERLFFFSCELAGYDWIKVLPRNLDKASIKGQLISSHSDLLNFINHSKRKLIPLNNRT